MKDSHAGTRGLVLRPVRWALFTMVLLIVMLLTLTLTLTDMPSGEVPKLAVLAAVTLLVGAGGYYLVTRRAIRNLDHFVAQVQHFAERGALTPLPSSSSLELGEIAAHVNQVVDRFTAKHRRLEELTEQLRGTSFEAASHHEHLQRFTRRHYEETSQLSNRIGDLTDSLQFSLDQCSLNQRNLNQRNLNQCSPNGIDDSRQPTPSTNGVGAQASAPSADLAASEFAVATEFLERLSARSTAITETTQIALAVTAQTQLVSMNASIETAAAGKFAEGFAVVTEEMDHLADNSRRAAHRIRGLLGGIHDDTESLTDQFHRVRRSMQNSCDREQELQRQIQSLRRETQSALQSLDAVREVLEDHTRCAQEIADSVTQMAQSMAQSCQRSGELGRSHGHLEQQVERLQAELQSD